MRSSKSGQKSILYQLYSHIKLTSVLVPPRIMTQFYPNKTNPITIHNIKILKLEILIQLTHMQITMLIYSYTNKQKPFERQRVQITLINTSKKNNSEIRNSCMIVFYFLVKQTFW